MDRAFATIAAWHRRAEHSLPQPDAAVPEERRQAMLASLDALPPGTIDEKTSKVILAQYGIPCVEERLARSPAEAVEAATALGYPVALKIVSEDLPHKSDVGGVELGLKDAASVGHAYQRILTALSHNAPVARIGGILVQPMAAGPVEVMVGGRWDPQLGPLILVGMGGTLTEVLADTVLDLAPVSRSRARDMLLALKGAALFGGVRGRPAIAIDRLADAVARASHLIADAKGRIAEFDINPLRCDEDGVIAVDALIVLTERETSY
jgi:acetyl-CoA synthetase